MMLYYFKRTHACSNTTWFCITLKEHMFVQIQHDFVLLKEQMLVRIQHEFVLL
jgi:hypothetical protein